MRNVATIAGLRQPPVRPGWRRGGTTRSGVPHAPGDPWSEEQESADETIEADFDAVDMDGLLRELALASPPLGEDDQC
jgi:hypothetical protein